MGRVQLFEIRLSQGRVVYGPGEPLAGAVHLRLGAPLPFRGGRGVASGEVGRRVLTCGGAGLSETVRSVGSATGFSVSRKPRVTTEPRAPGTSCSGRPTEGRAGQTARWPSPSASVPSCALRLGGQKSVRGPKCLFTILRQPWR